MIKLRTLVGETYPRRPGWARNATTLTLPRGRQRRFWGRKGRNCVTTEAETGGMWPQAQNAWSHQKLEKAMDRLP